MSSDSSEDEDTIKLKEAVDQTFINDSMYKQRPEKLELEQTIEKLPSLRRINDEDEQFNLFRVTPEFRKHVAKHLSKMLDRVLDDKIKKRKNGYTKPIKPQGGIKLFKNSSKYVKISETTSNIQMKKPCNTKKPCEEVIDNSEKLKSIVITGQDILNQKEVKFWSNRSKAPIYKYKKTNTSLELIELTTF